MDMPPGARILLLWVPSYVAASAGLAQTAYNSEKSRISSCMSSEQVSVIGLEDGPGETRGTKQRESARSNDLM